MHAMAADLAVMGAIIIIELLLGSSTVSTQVQLPASQRLHQAANAI